MSSGRLDLLIPILDELAVHDHRVFHRIEEEIRSDPTEHERVRGSSIAFPISEAFTAKISERAEEIFREIQRVVSGAYVENFDELSETLKREWVMRLKTMADVASSQFQSAAQIERKSRSFLESVSEESIELPPETTFSDHVEKLKAKWFAEIELFCLNLHDSQTPRLFLNAGEVFTGNRAARTIFTAAKQSINIIDTYLGPSVFDMLELTSASVRIRIITNKADAATKLAYTLFNQQFNKRAEFRLSDPSTHKQHDRFIVIDGARALHLGGSIKDLGKSDSLIDSAELEPHQKRFEEVWLSAQPVA
jgi:hypothetical protein